MSSRRKTPAWNKRRIECGVGEKYNRRETMTCESGSESLKLTKLKESKDIEAYLITFERAVQAHEVN